MRFLLEDVETVSWIDNNGSPSNNLDFCLLKLISEFSYKKFNSISFDCLIQVYIVSIIYLINYETCNSLF